MSVRGGWVHRRIVLQCWLLWLAAGASDVSDLIAWINDNGGTMDSRQTVGTGPDPTSTLRGIYATAPIRTGDVLLELPRKLIIADATQCGLVKLILEQLQLGKESKFWPYMKVMEDHNIMIPNVWTPEELSLIRDLPFAVSGVSNSGDLVRHTTWYGSDCKGNLSNVQEMRALLLFVARANECFGGFCMCSIYDMYNHRMGKWRNTAVNNEDDVFRMVATQDIGTGEQLYNPYNSPDDGSGTPSVLREYGFIEQTPQVWWLDHTPDRSHFFEILDSGEVKWPKDSLALQSPLEFIQRADELLSKLEASSFAPVHHAHTDDVMHYRKAYMNVGSEAYIKSLSHSYRQAYKQAVRTAVVAAKSLISAPHVAEL